MNLQPNILLRLRHGRILERGFPESPVHTALLEYISSAFWHLPDGLDGFVQALYAIGGEAPQILHPNSP